MDNNVPRSITVGLRMQNIDVLTALEDGMAKLKMMLYSNAPVNFGEYCSRKTTIC